MRIRILKVFSAIVLAACSREHTISRQVERAQSTHNAIAQSSPTGPLRVGNDVTAPVVVKRFDPVLPTRMNAAGPLILEMVVGTSGRARDIKILRDGTSPRLGPRYVKALEQWHFQPGTLHGQPVDVVFDLSVSIDVR